MNKLHRNIFSFVFCVLVPVTALPALAQTFPDKPITVIVPWPPGGSVDLSARALTREMVGILGQSFVLDNRGGAAGSIGSLFGARAAKDGYTLTFGNATSHATDAVTMPALGYDPVKDFAPISLVHKSTMCLVMAKDAPVTTLQEFFAYAKANPGLAYGSPGIGTPQHLIGELLNQKAGLTLNHIPYRGGGPVVNDLLGGHIKVGIGGLSQFLALHERGDVKIIAIADDQRHPAIPKVPTLAEALPGLNVTGWALRSSRHRRRNRREARRRGAESDGIGRFSQGAGRFGADPGALDTGRTHQTDAKRHRAVARTREQGN